MNRLTKFLLLILFLFFAKKGTATHLYGGEIRWECLSNGKYQFFVDVYIDCFGIPYNPIRPHIKISGYPLPKNAQNIQISGIPISSYSTNWLKNRDRDLSPQCKPRNNYGPISCEDEDNGSFQMYSYKTDPITLKGTPPKDGWMFKLDLNTCCRPEFENFKGGSLDLRAIMYPITNDSSKKVMNIYPCIDNSPQFRSIPVNNICRGNKFSYNLTAIDYELDSLAYSWGEPLTGRYLNGFDHKNPTPGFALGYDNIPSTLDTISGLIKMKIDSGVGVDKYLFVIKVDSYRNGHKNATIIRELPIAVFDCPLLPNGEANQPPEVKINNKLVENEVIELIAGDRVDIPIVVSDSDNTGVSPISLQFIRLVPDGLMFTNDRSSSTNCDSLIGLGSNLVVEPCAYLQSREPYSDTNLFPPFPSIRGLGVLSTNFVWETDCRHIQTKTGVPGSNLGIYRFVMRVTDDHCPIPAINYPTITIKVRDPYPLKAPILKGIDVGLDGKINYQWVPPIDSSSIFTGYLTEFSATIAGAPPIWRDTINNHITNYKQAYRNDSISIYTLSDPPKINPAYRNRDVHVRLSTNYSSCNRDGFSLPSEAVKIIKLNANIKKDSTNQQSIDLTWNAAKTSNARSYSYFTYESETTYYIWRNDSSKVRTLKDWRLVASTKKVNYSLPNDACGEKAAFRIEARDTVITWKKGSSTTSKLNKLDTLTFSTFSLIDTVLLKEDLTPPNEFSIDLISFDHESEEIVVSWDTPNPGGIDSIFFISDIDFTSNPPNFKIVGEQKWDIASKQYSIPTDKVDASSNVVLIGAIAQDACGNRKLPSISKIHNSIDLDVDWEGCDSSMYIRWNNYQNFEGESIVYSLLVDTVGSFKFEEVIRPARVNEGTFKHKIYDGGKFYRYMIKFTGMNSNGFDLVGYSNIDSAYARYEEEPKVGYISNVTVLNSDYVQLDYLLDTLIPVKNYSILRGVDSTKLNPIDIISSGSIHVNKLTYYDRNVSVSEHAYFYKVNANNQCDLVFHHSNFGSSIFLEVESGQESLKNLLKWNGYKKWDSNVSHYNIYRGVDQFPSNNVYERIDAKKIEQYVYADDISGHTDAIGKYCYQVEAVKNKQGTQGEVVISRSNVYCLAIKPLFYVPNAFVPDGINNTFLPKGQFINHSYYEMRIYNRYGNELFSTRDIKTGWNGTYNGKKVKTGTYVYIIRFKDSEGKDHTIKGTVTLL